MSRDPEKARDRKRRYLERQKVAKYGPDAAGVDMRGRHGNHARGANNARWNNGRMRTSGGYIAVRVPDDHHLRQAHGYAYEHDIVAEQTLGRRLAKGEVVHHKNGQRDDNRPENLEVATRSDHAREHADHPGARDEFGRFRSGAPRHGDPAEWPQDLNIREFPKVEGTCGRLF